MDGGGAHGAGGFNGGGNHGLPGAFGVGSGGGGQGAYGGGGGAGGQFHGVYHGDGRGPPHGWSGGPHGHQMAHGGGNNVQMHGGPVWNSFMPQQTGAFGNGGFNGNQNMGNGGFMPPNHPNGFPNNHHGGGSQEGMAMGYGSGNFNQAGACFDPGYGSSNSGQNRGGPRQRGRGRGSRGGRNQGSRGGRHQEAGGGRGHFGLQHQQQTPPPPTTVGANGNAAPANATVVENAKARTNAGGAVVAGTKSHAGQTVGSHAGTKDAVPVAAPVKQSNTVFLKPAVIDDSSLEDGQCSKENDVGEEEMNIDMDEVPEKDLEAGANKGKKDKEKWCFRCCSKGHVKEVCKVDLFCTICESEEHVAAKCPMKRKPRPMAYAVGYAVDQLGFYHIPHGPINMAKKDGLTALIKVKGGHLKEEELVGHLKRLVPGKFEWDVQLHAPDTWIAPFPSKAELKRTINFGAADLKDGKSLSFELYEEEEYFGEEMPFVWMKVTNLPRVLRSYEVLWAIGTMFGATQRVDMVTTRKNSFGRFKVVVMDPNIVPTQMDVVIGSRFFELQFEIEPFDNTNARFTNVKRNDSNGDDSANQQKGKGKKGSNKKHKSASPAAGTSEIQQTENGKDASNSEMKENELFDDMEEDDLLDEEWVVNESDSGHVTVEEINKVDALNEFHCDDMLACNNAATLVANSAEVAAMEQNKTKPVGIGNSMSCAPDDGSELGTGCSADMLEICASKGAEHVASRAQVMGAAGGIEGAAPCSEGAWYVSDVNLVASGVHEVCATGGNAVEVVAVASSALSACATGGIDDVAVGDHAEPDGGEKKMVEDPETPSLALGPLLERAINELKGSKGSTRMKVTDGSTVENKVVKPDKAITPIGDMSTPLRRSLRRAGSVDEDSTDRASRMVAKRNLEDIEVR
ncbi:hypothetical protein EJB05_09301, partial [Eragrostis curvula]